MQEDKQEKKEKSLLDKVKKQTKRKLKFNILIKFIYSCTDKKYKS